MMTLDYILSVPQRGRASVEPEIRINCPECDDDKFHMYCNMTKMVYFCQKCNARGKIIKSVQMDAIKWGEYEPRLKEPTPKELKESDILEKLDAPTYPRKSVINLPYSSEFFNYNHVNTDASKAYEYLISRGLTREDVIGYKIRYSLEKTGPHKNTVIFPIYSNTTPFANLTLLEYFVARKYDGTEPKYINASWSKKAILFTAIPGLNNNNYKGPYSPLFPVICEGIFDALAISKVGWSAFALLSKHATGEQLLRLQEIHAPNGFIIYLDKDAFTHAIHLKMQLSALGIKSVVTHTHPDAADLYLKDRKHLIFKLADATAKLRHRDE